MSDRATILEQVASYYGNRVREHGDTAQGVDWNSRESQELRFHQLLQLVPASARDFSILDYGCGYGALVDALTTRGQPFRYIGYDVSDEMIARARKRHPRPECIFGTDLEELGVAEYAVASGVLNVKLDVPQEEWREHVLACVADLDRTSLRGFAFNALTTYADADRMIDKLYYADPLETFDYCKRTYSRNVALLHDYGLYEFTILVRKDVA